MIIHTVGENEALRDIARRYNTSPTQLAESNGLSEGEQIIVGEELIVPIPTRTYTVKSGDTLAAIARRFGVKKQELLSINPSLSGKDDIYPTQSIAIKYERENLGMAAANGYLCQDCRTDDFYRTLPYLVYITLCGAITDGEKVYPPKRCREIATEIKHHGRLPLLRIYDKTDGSFLESETKRSNLCDSIIDTATAEGFCGVVIASNISCSDKSYSGFLFELRKKMIGSALILLTESHGECNSCATELTDGNILVYSKIDDTKDQSFEECEAKMLHSYAERSESSKTFVDLCAHAFNQRNYIPLKKARADCLSLGARIKTNQNTLISSYIGADNTPVYYESLSNIKAKLQLIGELGYMGINVDISNVPTSHLVMYHMMFSPVFHTFTYSDI